MNATFEMTDLNPMFMFKEWAIGSQKQTDSVLRDPATQKLLNDVTQHFDLIILDLLFNEALMGKFPENSICGFKNKFEIPKVLVHILMHP